MERNSESSVHVARAYKGTPPLSGDEGKEHGN